VSLIGVREAVLEERFLSAVTEAALRIPNCSLIILDPLAKLLPSDRDVALNTQEGAGLLHARIDELVRATGATVLVAHHIGKLAQREGAELQSLAATGSHLLVDLARVVLNLRTLSPKDIAARGLDRKRGYVELAASKLNYSLALAEPIVFRREKGGALAYEPAGRPEEVDADRARQVLLEADEPLTREEWEKRCHELEPPISFQRARSARTLLVHRGDVLEVRGGSPARGPAKTLFVVPPPPAPVSDQPAETRNAENPEGVKGFSNLPGSGAANSPEIKELSSRETRNGRNPE
jgi:RecA-family ATPase